MERDGIIRMQTDLKFLAFLIKDAAAAIMREPGCAPIEGDVLSMPKPQQVERYGSYGYEKFAAYVAYGIVMVPQTFDMIASMGQGGFAKISYYVAGGDGTGGIEAEGSARAYVVKTGKAHS